MSRTTADRGSPLPASTPSPSTNKPPPPASKAQKKRPPVEPKPPEIEPDVVVHARSLGLSGAFVFDDVKKHYHDRIKEYHPDKVAALGSKLRELAEVESKKINAAYEFFSKKFRADHDA